MNGFITMAEDPLMQEAPESCRGPLQGAVFHPAGLRGLLEALHAEAPPRDVNMDKGALRKWEVCALVLRNADRLHDASALLREMYFNATEAQDETPPESGVKGTALVWLSDVHLRLGHPALAQRYIMLTLCEDIIGASGEFTKAKTWGGYWRARAIFGMTDAETESVWKAMFAAHEKGPGMSKFPEWVLQQVDDAWRTELPSTRESGQYVINPLYARHLLANLGLGDGKNLELLTQYFLSCIPGWRAKLRARTPSTDYDVVCTVEGSPDDFRRDLGRYVLCECKDWEKPADFTTMAKFARVLESAKCRCGVLVSRNGVSGEDATKDAAREQLKVYQDTGIAILVLSKTDLEAVAGGRNLIQLLRSKYDQVRLDLA